MGQFITKTKEIINRSLQTVLPAKAYLNFMVWKRGFEEPEMRLVYEFCDKALITIDVGAANGSYLAHTYKLSKACYAFEPRKSALQNLIKVFSPITDNIQFENVALSDQSGTTKFKVLRDNERLSTMESTNDIEKFGAVDIHEVTVKRLDGYAFEDQVGFVKIDVEGHEEAVVRGALGLIKKDLPVLLIEIEERHKTGSVMRIKEILQAEGYLGFYYLGEKLNDIGSFSIEQHQDFGNPNKPYIFNFIYIHSSAISRFSHLVG